MSELKIEEIVVGEGDEVKDGDWGFRSLHRLPRGRNEV